MCSMGQVASNFTKRRVSMKCGNPSENMEDVRQEFLGEIVETVELGKVSADLIFNWDQTGILMVPSGPWTRKAGKEFQLLGTTIRGK